MRRAGRFFGILPMRGFVALSAILSLLTVRAQSVSELGDIARVLFAHQSFETSVTTEFAAKYVRSTPKTKLKRDLESVLAKFGLDSPQGGGAAYLMALHGIDVSHNLGLLKKLAALHPFNRKKLATESEWNNTVRESIPSALGEIMHAQHSVQAARDLIASAISWTTETEGDEIYDAFKHEPDLMASAAVGGKKLEKVFLEELIEGSSEQSGGEERVRQIARSRSRHSSGRVRKLFLILTKSSRHWAPN